MKKQFITPVLHLRSFNPTDDIIVTSSSVSVTNDPANSGEALSRERSGASWSDYEQ